MTDIWLKDNFNFANTFLFNIEDDDLIVESILNDEYFGVDFTDIITKIYMMEK